MAALLLPPLAALIAVVELLLVEGTQLVVGMRGGMALLDDEVTEAGDGISGKGAALVVSSSDALPSGCCRR